MQIIKYARGFSLIIAACMLAACAGGSGGDGGSNERVTFNAQALKTNTADNIITPTYVNLSAAASNLLAAVNNLNDGDPTEADMDAAQQAWKDARVPWESSEGFIFGPVEALGVDPAVDSWPLDTTELATFLQTNPNATKADVKNADENLKGFHAIEFLLFGDGVADNEKTAAELAAQSGAINYLVALVEAFKERTDSLEASWTTDFQGDGPYADILKAPGANNSIYLTDAAVMQELVEALIGIVDEVGNAKIGEALGTSVGNADTSKVESQYSWNSLTDFSNNIQSVMNIYTGKLGFDWQTDGISDTNNGVYTFVLAHDSNLAMRVFKEIRTVQQQIALIKGDGDNTTTEIGLGAQPFRTQIKDPAGRALIGNAVDALGTLVDTLLDDVRPLVGQTDFQ